MLLASDEMLLGKIFWRCIEDIFGNIHGDTRQDTSAMKQGLKCK